jgi:phosphoglycerate dehydrogenase-like enzyme
VLTLPLTPETKGIIGEKEFRLMKPTAYLINIGRGRLIDEDALIGTLARGEIAGAGLDVFATEPLPADSGLWNLPNVIVTPHISGAMADYHLRATAIFRDNLKRFLAGKKLINVVDKQRGY